MATVSDITVTPTSGLTHIDALLDTGPDWNYLTPAGNTILYTFSVASGNEAGQTGQTAFSASQQTHTRAAFAAISALTGITFTETASGTSADVHLAAVNISGNNVSGLCSWNSSYGYTGTTLNSYDAQAYVYLDNAEFAGENANLTPGTGGYQTLLHELGHMLGLKHPFEGSAHLETGDDNTSNTLMSYTSQGGPYANFSPYDIAALNWLYGGDGLRGTLGINSTGGRYITGTSFADTMSGSSGNDRFEGDGGDDALNGGNGTDTAVFRGNYASYTVTDLGGGSVRVTGADGMDTLTSIEMLQFDDQSVQSGQVVTPPAGDTSAPAAPTLALTKNANGYVTGDKPIVTGSAEANATVKVYSGATLVATTTAGANGTYSVATSSLADGINLSLTARATDAANNVSVPSAALLFSVDTVAPVAPTASVVVSASGAALFNGTGEAGSTIRLTNASAIIAEGTVASDGNWSLGGSTLSNGSYDVSVSSLDKAGNNTTATKHLLFAVGSAATVTGTAGDDSLLSTPGNNVIDGGSGTDSVSYTGARGNYNVVRDSSGFVVTARSGADGMDLLRNVESIKFGDSTLKLEYDDVVQALYVAYFGRAADSGGLAAFQSQLGGLKAPQTFPGVTAAYATDTGVHSLIDSFGSSTESAALYPGATSAFVTAVFQNIFGRAPAASGLSFWTNAIDNGGLSRANASLSIMAGALENTSTQGLLDAKLVNNKIIIASDFTLAIDNPTEVSGYVGINAAATVRSMLASVTASTDIAAFQAVIASTIASLPGLGAQTVAGMMQIDSVQSGAALDTPIALVGVQHGGLIDAVM
ncbi:Ig-like domain-containing protein [Massilia pseudoviolaceinigra]|uniref:Ig-like domain-containing protein n=1 Tax=Massilia pseudoviolaceinigra TaxID=3057165 RepID=UPI0027968031|nr:Ig-like domain-containing protein [Massilia sp. CCM 9206]MDQ1924058.1 Ig-like domain-containing protein [Massilia sp. CCM 9206]